MSCQPRGGKTTTAKLEVELSNNKAPSTLLTSPGGRHRPQPSAVKRAKANARAAQHRIHQALPFPEGDYGAAVGPPLCSPPPPRRPLNVHPSPTCEDRCRIVTVKRKAGWKGRTEISHSPAIQRGLGRAPSTTSGVTTAMMAPDWGCTVNNVKNASFSVLITLAATVMQIKIAIYTAHRAVVRSVSSH